MASAYYNADGLNVKQHGEYERDYRNFVNRTKATNTFGVRKQLVMEIDLKAVGASTTWFPVDRNNNGTNDGFSEEELFIPAGACITSAIFVCSQIAAGGTSFAVGTYDQAGATIDDDGIVTDTEGVIASMDHVGDIIIGNGVLVADTSGGSGPDANSYLAVKTVGTFTAGKGWLIVEYIVAS